MFSELMRSFLLIFAAEMGDKTQILAMTFATQYKVRQVLLGVFLGVFLNHGLAIVLGRYISKIVPMSFIQIVAGLLFVVFGILALIDEDDEEQGKDKKNFGPVMTVALAFFVGELGDKTQLTAMTLATEGSYPFFILMGTTLGMIAVSGIGIFIGSKIGEKIPDIFIKLISSLVFITFGTLKLFQTIPSKYLTSLNIGIYFGILLLLAIILIRKLIVKRKSGEKSALKEVAATLYMQTQELNEAVNNICLGEGTCGICMRDKCIIGYTKKILRDARENEEYYIDDEIVFNVNDKKFDIDKVVEALSLVIEDYIRYGVDKDDKFIVNKVRVALEKVAFGNELYFDGNIDKYIKNIYSQNQYIGTKIEESIVR